QQKKYLTEACDASDAQAPLGEPDDIVDSSSWVQPQSQPYPYRKNLLTAEQQAVSWNTSTSPEVVEVSSWVQPQTQPYPSKPYLTTANQQAFFWQPDTSITPPTLYSNWLPVYPDKVYGKQYL